MPRTADNDSQICDPDGLKSLRHFEGASEYKGDRARTVM